MPQTLPHPPTPTLLTPTVAYNATYLEVWGQALRTTDGHVHFLAESTGLWQELFNHDAPALLLHGRLDLIQEARLTDALHGHLYQPRQAA